MLAFFEVITISAPHIYMSALPLSPKTSIVHGLYQHYAHFLARVVQGQPVGWDPVVTTASAKHSYAYVWSPCNRFIAVSTATGVQILDAATLEQVNILNYPDSFGGGEPSFSPNGQFLTQFNGEKVTSWDLQTGGLVCTIISKLQPSPKYVLSSTYSMDGNMFAILYQSSHGIISTYNLLSGTYTNSHCELDGHVIAPIWTHGECFRFTVVKLGSITIWEAGFNLIDTPTEVGTLPVPDEIAGAGAYLFLPTLSQLAFTLQNSILVWDTRTSKFLLNSGPILLHFNPPHLSEAVFSLDGHFFIYLTNNRKVYVWKKSLTCYVLHQKLTISGNSMCSTPFVSPSGKSVIVVIEDIIHLCHTEDQILFSTHAPIYYPFTLGFSPQNEWAAFALHEGKTVTVLHLQSGNPQLVIDTDIDVEYLMLTESTIIVAGGKKVATFNLSAGNSTSNTRMNIGDSVQAITLENISDVLSTSPNLNYIACRPGKHNYNKLEIYELSTGKCILNATLSTPIYRVWFTLDGHSVWAQTVCSDLPAIGWKIIQDSESGVTKLKPLDSQVSPPERPSWRSSSYGYQIVDDVWVLSASQKRLLWLPPHWRTDGDCKIWNGNFLGLRHAKPREVVIVEFLE